MVVNRNFEKDLDFPPRLYIVNSSGVMVDPEELLVSYSPNRGKVTKVLKPLHILLACLGRSPFKPKKWRLTPPSTSSLEKGIIKNRGRSVNPIESDNLNTFRFIKGDTSPGINTVINNETIPFSLSQNHEGTGFDYGQSSETSSEYITSSLKSLSWIYFIFTTFLLTIVLLFSTMGFCDYVLDWDLFTFTSPTPSSTNGTNHTLLDVAARRRMMIRTKWEEEEQRNFQSNLVPFVLVWSCLMHSSISSISFIINRVKVVQLLNYWNWAVDEMNMELPRGIKRYIWSNHLMFFAFLVVIFLAYRVMHLGVIRGGATLVGILTFRPLNPLFHPESVEELYFLASNVRLFGVVTILYSVYASRAFLFLFSFKCKLLRHALRTWNERFEQMLMISACGREKSVAAINGVEQANCKRLFEDYRVILKLVSLMDKAFGAILQSYYGSQLSNMCFELYYLASSGSHGHLRNSSLDVVAAAVILVQNVYIFFNVSLDAAYVNEEASRGMEILKSFGTAPTDGLHKKYLIRNMQLIFSQNVVLTGGKYFRVDRPFIVTVLGAVFTYFIIVLQVGPSLHKRL